MKTYAAFFYDIPTMKSIGGVNDKNGVQENEGTTPVQEAVDNAKEAFKEAANAGAVAAATIGAELAARVEEKLRKLGIDPVILSEGAEGSEAEGSFDFSKVTIEPLFEEMVDFDTFSKSDFRAVKVKDCVAVPKSKKLLQRNKIDSFVRATDCKKTVQLVMVTTYGLKPSKYNSLVNSEVELDDLFYPA